jgi:SAM-dependent methyltransferase
MSEENITFSFGKNWRDYLATVTAGEIDAARIDLEHWLGIGWVEGRTVLDIGSGSGIHSLGFLSLKARAIRSFDYDANSVQATRCLWEKAGRPVAWTVSEGSILDEDFIEKLGKFDLVYSWGVLHHTGAMWKALDHAARLVGPGGKLFISLYASGPRYASDLALKRRYNAASAIGKRMMECRWIANLMLGRLLHAKNPFAWNEKRERGMNVYHDIIDWLGGVPYEVAGDDETLQFFRQRGFQLERMRVAGEGGCSIFVFGRQGNL